MKDQEFVVRGVAHDINVAKLAVLGVPDRPGIAYKVFHALAQAHIDVDMIVQSIRDDSRNINDIVFTVGKKDIVKARAIVEQMGKEINALGVTVDDQVAKVSIIGAGMLGCPGIAAAMFGALGDAGVNIQIISTSEISVTCLISAAQVQDAVSAIHARFFPEGDKI